MHQPLDTLEVDHSTHIDNLGTDRVSSVSVVTHLVDRANTLGHDLIPNRAFAERAAAPVGGVAGVETEIFAQGLDR